MILLVSKSSAFLCAAFFILKNILTKIWKVRLIVSNIASWI